MKMKEHSLFDSLPEEPQKPAGPVTGLGLTFDNDEARRGYFTEERRQKLQDPEFRKIEGFPIGSDEDILNLSDPPYYTACPNPWIPDFIAELEKAKPRINTNKHESEEHNSCEFVFIRGSEFWGFRVLCGFPLRDPCWQ